MARAKRICPVGEVFHVLNRVVARLTIFEKPEDYAAFMRVVEETWGIVRLPICDRNWGDRNWGHPNLERESQSTRADFPVPSLRLLPCLISVY